MVFLRSSGTGQLIVPWVKAKHGAASFTSSHLMQKVPFMYFTLESFSCQRFSSVTVAAVTAAPVARILIEHKQVLHWGLCAPCWTIWPKYECSVKSVQENQILLNNMTNAHVIIAQILIQTVRLLYLCCTAAITMGAVYKISKSRTCRTRWRWLTERHFDRGWWKHL